MSASIEKAPFCRCGQIVMHCGRASARNITGFVRQALRMCRALWSIMFGVLRRSRALVRLLASGGGAPLTPGRRSEPRKRFTSCRFFVRSPEEAIERRFNFLRSPAEKKLAHSGWQRCRTRMLSILPTSNRESLSSGRYFARYREPPG